MKMNWIVFSCSFPAKTGSSPRVDLWRQLRRLGAVSPTGGLYVLPEKDECAEAFQWLSQKVKAAGGEAVIMHIRQFEGMENQDIIDLFRRTRKQDYDEVNSGAAELEKMIASPAHKKKFTRLQKSLEKLQLRYADIVRIDYFGCPEAKTVASRLTSITKALSPAQNAEPEVKRVKLEQYRGKVWVTRPHPHVDRMVCAWFIRKFINPRASIRYASAAKRNEVAFDMSDGEFGHIGNMCCFETMIRAFGMKSPVLAAMAEIVHEIDLHDGNYFRTEITGVETILHGWQKDNLSDSELEFRGVALFEGLYQGLPQNSAEERI
jgi:hypothetical protein